MPYVAGGVLIGVFSVVSIVLFGASWFQTILLSTNNYAAVVSAVLVDLANADRQGAGIDTLTVNPQLVAAAQAKANDMAENGYFSHNGPDGKEPWAWIREAGYAYQYAGENLAIQFSDSAEVERAWLASELHRKNILDGRFTEVGIATAYGAYQGQPTTFVVQMFGSPRQATAVSPSKPRIAQAASTPSSVNAFASSAVLGESTTVAPKQASPIQHIAASPKTYFDYALTLIAAFIFAMGAFAWWHEMRQHHVRHSFYAVALCLALLAFVYSADAFIFTKPIIADTLVTTSV